MAAALNKKQTIIEITAADRDDARLVRLCRKGDQSAWEEIVDKYQRLINTIPRRAGLNEEQAADVFQEVFVTLLEKIDAIEQPDKLRAWLVTVAKFKTWQTVRGGKDTRSIDDDESGRALDFPDKAPLADDAVIELEQQHIIRAGLQKMDERCREILTLIYLHEPAFSYAQVAKRIGVGETSISPMRARCLQKLAKIIGK